MNAWQRLLAASSLALGTAWQLISSPRTGGSGVTVNNGATVVIADNALTVALADTNRIVTLADSPVSVVLVDSSIIAAIQPGITVQITTQPITV